MSSHHAHISELRTPSAPLQLFPHEAQSPPILSLDQIDIRRVLLCAYLALLALVRASPAKL